MTGVLQTLIGGFGAAAAAVTDAYFYLVTLLLPGNGTNGAQNNTFLDSSSNNFTITRNGNTTQGTFSPFSQTGWSNYFDGTGDTLTLPNNAAFAMSNGAFTIEFWFYTDSITQTGYILQTDINSTALYVSFSSSTLRLTDAGTVYVSTPTLVANTWNHIAVVRSGTGSNQTVIYTNGVAGTAGTCAQSFTQSGPTVGANGYLGYISNLRIVKGSAVYTSGFTPPTAPLTNITNTSLLTCQSNRFVDNSTANSGSGFAITVNGNTSVQAFSPFAPTAAYSAATVGGSGYFDGNGDYLANATAAVADFGTGDFTFECWFYLTALSSSSYYQIFSASNTVGGFQVYKTITSNDIVWDVNGTKTLTLLSGSSLSANSWYHIAVVRSGSGSNNLKTYVNGSQTFQYTDTTNFTVTGAYVGAFPTGVSTWPGYIAGLRILKGTAQAPSGIPTAPPTAITNTSFLLNFTNAGITDATAKNVLETVGNAQISTTQSKFGGSSMYFDGTGDYLPIPSSENLGFGTGDFTIEGWLYLNATSSFSTIISNRNDAFDTTTGRYSVAVRNSAFEFYANGAQIISSGTISTSTWTHFAVTRASGSARLFLNGTQVGSTTSFTTSLATRITTIGANNAGGEAINAYIDDFRITKGYARYTANFTAPTAAFALQ